VEYGSKTWLDELLSILPFKENTNFVIDPLVLRQLDVSKKDFKDLGEKVYAYACFIPQGKYSGAVLYNSDPKSLEMRDKSLYEFTVAARKRQYPIELKFKKVRRYKIERKFIKE
jgi:hypothetical protein